MDRARIVVKRSATGMAIDYDGEPVVVDLGAGIPVDGRWRWSFDGTLAHGASEEGQGSDQLGSYALLTLTYADEAGPMIRQTAKVYQDDSFVVVETTALRELRGTALGDSFFETTFNSPVVRLAGGMSYLTYTWGLLGGEGPGTAGNFPDVALAPDLAGLPERLRSADFSPDREVHHTGEKPFAPLIGYDSRERTLVMSPLNHYLVSPMRLVETPDGAAVARGLHGSVDVIPAGTTTHTVLAFGTGLAPTVLGWGELLFRAAGRARGEPRDSLLTRSLGFWNCFGGYYADLFRPTDAGTLEELAGYFREVDLPVRYWGLDLWYQYDNVGFVRGYQPDLKKYPDGLKPVFQGTRIPFLLHMAAFEQDNHYLDRYDFAVDEGSSYPTGPELYLELAREFKDWGATGIWHDFLRTQLHNCRTLREQLGAADRWFGRLAASMAETGLDVMLCMPTMGHYMASAAYDNVVAIRTSTDFVNHQQGQLELLAHLHEYRRAFSPQRNLRQNLMLSFLAGALGLAPSYDVFVTNRDHPEGFANPHAARDGLVRALSAGIVGVGDRLGCVDREVVDRLAFPDGTLAQPDHPPYPVASSLQSDAPAFHTATLVSGHRWSYLLLLNLSEEDSEYRLDLGPWLEGNGSLVYDCHAGRAIAGRVIEGRARPGESRYLVIVPRVGGLYPLGFSDKYVPVSGRQVKAVSAGPEGVSVDLELPAENSYTFAVLGAGTLSAGGQGIDVGGVEQRGELTCVTFRVRKTNCRLRLRRESKAR